MKPTSKLTKTKLTNCICFVFSGRPSISIFCLAVLLFHHPGLLQRGQVHQRKTTLALRSRAVHRRIPRSGEKLARFAMFNDISQEF